MQYILEQREYDNYQELIKHAKITQGQSIVITRPAPNNNYWNRSCVYNIPEGLEEIRKDLEDMRNDLASHVSRDIKNEAEMTSLKYSSLWNFLKWKFDWK